MPWEGVLGIAEVLDIAEVEEGWDREGFEEDCWVVRESGAETGTLGGSRTISNFVTRFLGAVEEGASKTDLL